MDDHDPHASAQEQASTSPVLLALAQVPQSLIGQKQQRIFPRGSSEKLLTLEGTEAETQRLGGFLSEELTALSAQRVVAEKSLSKGVWKEELRVVEITAKKGSHWASHGHSHSGSLLLLPEEALFLMECGSLEVQAADGLPLSLQQAYHTLLSEPDLIHYQVYSSLKRLGYIVRRIILSPGRRPSSPGRRPSSSERKAALAEECIKTVSCCPLCTSPRPPPESHQLLEVYKPKAGFQKSSPGTPAFRVMAARPKDHFPGVGLLGYLGKLHPTAPLKFCIVDSNSTVYYSIATCQVPTLSSSEQHSAAAAHSVS